MLTRHTDDAEAFLTAVEGCTWPGDQFTHRAHVRLAWLYLHRYGWDEAATRIEATIRRYATSLGAANKYHQTITVAWLHLVAAAMAASRADASFDALLNDAPHLLDPRALSVYYSTNTLTSEAARSGWVEPDLTPLPRVTGALTP
jgi:hypothetical protein